MVILSKRQRAIKKLRESQDDLEENQTIKKYLRDLEVIVAANESFLEQYTHLKEVYDKLMVKERNSLEGRRNTLLSRFNTAKLNKDIYDYTRKFDSDLRAYKDAVKKFESEFDNIVTPTQDLINRLISPKGRHREIKEDLEKYRDSLGCCIEALDNFIDSIDRKIEKCESLISTGYFDRAEVLINKIEEDIGMIYGRIPQIAEYCNLVCVQIPEELETLLNKQIQLTFEGYFINHLRINDLDKEVKQSLAVLKDNFSKLQFGGFESQHDEIESKINMVNEALDQEISCKETFDNKHQEVLFNVQKIESQTIYTRKQYNLAKEYYILSDAVEERYQKFQNDVTKLSDKKGEFQNFVYSYTRNPYSFMIKKMEYLNFQCQSLNDEIQFFNNYFKGLKSTAENINNNQKKYAKKLMQTVASIRYSKFNEIIDNYQENINQGFIQLKQIHDDLRNVPINISDLTAKFASVSANINELCSFLNGKLDEGKLALQAILYANQIRADFNEANIYLENAEQLFRQQEYSEASKKVITILKQYHPSAYEKLGGN